MDVSTNNNNTVIHSNWNEFTMISSTKESLGPETESLLLQLRALVPKTTETFSKLKDLERTVLAVKITEVLAKVLNNPNSFEPEQQNHLMNIRELAKKAENLGLLESSKEAISKIASVAKEKGLSLFTAPRDLKIQTKDGEITVNSDMLKESSEMFARMFQSGMKEQQQNILELKNFSKETMELLMRILHAPSSASITLPKDNAIVLELIDLAMTYQLDRLISKLEPAVSQFIAEQPQTILENAEAWMSFLLKQKDVKYSTTATKWMDDMTPHFLNHFDIPIKPSDVPGKFEIPIEHSNCFLNEDTRDLLQCLPVVLEIKNGQDLAFLESVCKKYKDSESLSLKLLCKQGISADEEARFKNIAQASKIEISLEKLPIPSGTTFFGKEEWETYFGLVGEVPPLPSGIGELLSSPCPYFPGQTYKDTFMLTLIPATVNGNPLHLYLLRELVKNPKTGHRTDYDYVYPPILGEHGNIAPKSSYWALMSMKELPNSREKTYQEQQALVGVNSNFEVPDLLSGAVCILTHFVKTGVHLFHRGEDLSTLTRCKETVLTGVHRREQMMVGGFGAPGLCIYNDFNFAHRSVAVAALHKFFLGS